MTKNKSKIKVRGSIIEGIVVSTKPKNTAIIQREYFQFIPKYERYERRKTKINAHLPEGIDVKVGDKVKIGETRKISKTKSFIVMEKVSDKK